MSVKVSEQSVVRTRRQRRSVTLIASGQGALHEAELASDPPAAVFAPRGAAAIMRLQRTVGNRATLRTLERTKVLQRAPEQVAETPSAAAATSAGKLGSSELDNAVQKRLEQFLEKFSNIPVTVKWLENGEPRSTVVSVHPPYFINKETGGSKKRFEAAMKEREAATGSKEKAPVAADHRALIGKSTPEELAKILQNALDSGKVPTPKGKQHPDADDLRAWLIRYGIGIDCSGYVSQALNDIVAGLQGSGGLTGKPIKPINLGSAGLKGGESGFTKVGRPGEIRPGDTMWREGHIRIVTSAQQTPEGFIFTTAESTPGKTDIGPTSAEWRYPDAHKFEKLEKRSGKKWAAATGEAQVFGRYTALAQFGSASGGAGTSTAVSSTAVTGATVPMTLTHVGPQPAGQESSGWLKRAVEENTRLGGHLGWAQRIDEIVVHFQQLGYLSPLQTPNEEGFAWAIKKYQAGVGLKVDGILGPNSWRRLIRELKGATPTLPRPVMAAPVEGSELSGAAWVERFPTSRALADLQGDFRTKMESFHQALTAAGATVRVSATYRPPERAFLMHWSYRIARQNFDPRRVPAMAGVNILWWHSNLASSRAAAEDMVRAYDIAYRPALNSNHTRGTAIDMNVGWQGTLTVTDGQGRTRAAAGLPRTGMNPELWDIGATFGVIKHRTDRPHWSHNGG